MAGSSCCSNWWFFWIPWGNFLPPLKKKKNFFSSSLFQEIFSINGHTVRMWLGSAIAPSGISHKDSLGKGLVSVCTMRKHYGIQGGLDHWRHASNEILGLWALPSCLSLVVRWQPSFVTSLPQWCAASPQSQSHGASQAWSGNPTAVGQTSHHLHMSICSRDGNWQDTEPVSSEGWHLGQQL